MSRRIFAWAVILIVVVAGVAAASCGAANDNKNKGDDDDGSAASGAGTGVGGLEMDAGDNQDADICQADEVAAAPTPLDIILVVDRSGSMILSGYWNPCVNALNDFFNSPLSAGVNVGLNLFPHPNHSNDCNPANWNPVFVPNPLPLAELNQQASVLSTALAQNPSISGQLTPMYGALDGTYAFVRDYQLANPTHKIIVTVAGDGIPEGGYCSTFYGDSSTETLAGVAALAGEAYNNDGIETYAVAIASGVVATMNQIAASGGTGQAYDVSNDISAFAQKLQEIRENALGCEYLIPDPTEGDFDPFKVNVVFTPGGGAPETLPQADNLADCGDADGWYYDDPVTPTKILLCPATCDRAENDPDGTIAVQFGCPTEVN